MSTSCISARRRIHAIPRLRRKAHRQTVSVRELTEPYRMSSMLSHSERIYIYISNSCKPTLIRGWTPITHKERTQEGTASEKHHGRLSWKGSPSQGSTNCKTRRR